MADKDIIQRKLSYIDLKLGNLETLKRMERQDSLVQMVKFRNRIVHLYQEVDDSQIYRILQENLEVIKGFIQAVISKFF